MASMGPIQVDCPVCGGLIAFNAAATPIYPSPEGVATFKLSCKPDDLTLSRHRACGICPPGPGERIAS